MAERIAATRRAEAKVKAPKEVEIKTLKDAKGFKKIPVNGGKVATAELKETPPARILKLVGAKVPKVALAKSATKPVKVKKAKPKTAKQSKRVKGPGTAKFKFKPLPKDRSVCDVLNCREKPKTGFRCSKHKKIIRKAQLAANNVIWKKRVKAGTAGHHVVYTNPGKKMQATRFALKATEKALKIVRMEHSIVPTIKEFNEVLSRTKAAVKKSAKKAS